MAREATITQEQVNAAADSIRATGSKPTARAVRDRLGTGSMATVLKLLQAWQAGQVRPAAQDVTLPPALTRALVDFIAQEVAAAKAGLEADLADTQKAQADLIAENERQASTIEIQADALDQAVADKAEMAGKLGQMESDLASFRDEANRERQAAENARTDLAKAQLRLEDMPRLLAEVERLQQTLTTTADRAVKEAQSAAVLTAKLEASERRAAEIEDRERAAQARADKAEQLVKQNSQELANTRLQIQAQQTALDAQARELANAQEAAKEARASAKRSGEEAAELRGRLATPLPADTDRPEKKASNTEI